MSPVLGGDAREEAGSVHGSVALSPAAAILKCVHARTWRSPSPPLPCERGRLIQPRIREDVLSSSLWTICLLLGSPLRAGDVGWPPLSLHGQHHLHGASTCLAL